LSIVFFFFFPPLISLTQKSFCFRTLNFLNTKLPSYP
jgi:hypothetical protein